MTIEWKNQDLGWWLSEIGGIVKENNGLWHFYPKTLQLGYPIPYGKGFKKLNDCKEYAGKAGKAK